MMRKIAVLAVFAVLLAGTVAGAGVRAYDGFEDGDYTNNPTWTEAATGGTASVQQGTVKNGQYALELSTSTGDQALVHDRGTGSDTVNDGDIYQYWVRPAQTNDYLAIQLDNTGDGTEFSSSNSMTFQFSDGGQFRALIDGTSTNTGFFGSYSADTWYKIEIIPYPSTNDVEVKVFDSGGSELYYQALNGSTVLSDYQYVMLFMDNQNGASTAYFDDVSYSEDAANQAPIINSIGTEPDPVHLGDTVNVTANVTDPDGDALSNVSATVTEDGVQIADVPMPVTTAPDYKAVDAFVLDEANVWYNITVNATDVNGASSTDEIAGRITTGPGEPSPQINTLNVSGTAGTITTEDTPRNTYVNLFVMLLFGLLFVIVAVRMLSEID